MPPRRRSPVLPVSLAVLAVLVLLSVGIYLGGHPEDLPGPIRNALVSDDVKTTQEAFDLIEQDYYRKVKSSTLVNSGISGAVASLHDRFSTYLDPTAYRRFLEQSKGRFSGIGTEVVPDKLGLRVTRVFPGTPAAKAGIKAGDRIVAVGGVPIAGKPVEQTTSLIRGKPGTFVTITVQSGKPPVRRQVRVARAQVSTPSVAPALRTVNGVKLGYDAVSGFTSGVHGELRQAVERQRAAGAKGILIDMRSNGGGLLNEAVLVSSIFIEHGRIVSTKGRVAQANKVYDATGGALKGNFPIVVLVNHDTASAAEIVTAALQERRGAKVVGTRTFGKGVFQEVREMSNGGALDITVGQYFTPNGRNLGGGGVKEGAGIAPDIPVADVKRQLPVALSTLAAEARSH
ncbi:MAG TPA: S41 family peptidase [Solirubrobacteraceae bacterium]|jgi:carboxyl-terminal processing protease|nr:S41 family peptidase [Solirubrobacteraceae bacterium]